MASLEQGLDVGRAVIRTDSKMYSHAMKADTVNTEAPGIKAA